MKLLTINGISFQVSHFLKKRSSISWDFQFCCVEHSTFNWQKVCWQTAHQVAHYSNPSSFWGDRKFRRSCWVNFRRPIPFGERYISIINWKPMKNWINFWTDVFIFFISRLDEICLNCSIYIQLDFHPDLRTISFTRTHISFIFSKMLSFCL